jgi:hypothetical protein
MLALAECTPDYFNAEAEDFIRVKNETTLSANDTVLHYSFFHLCVLRNIFQIFEQPGCAC